VRVPDLSTLILAFSRKGRRDQMSETQFGSVPMNYAKQLRKNMTDAERALWRQLRSRQLSGHKFRRQQPIGKYIVDFVCLEKRLVIELDGGQHAEDAQAQNDSQRTAWLEQNGYRVLRFWNHEILHSIEAIKQAIFQALQ